MNPKVDWYFNKDTTWKKEVGLLRSIILDCDLVEVLKWGQPCYTYEGNNIVLIHDFKEYCALLFFKGALMKDPKKLLVQQTENVQSARQIRFTSDKDITKLKAVIKAYVYEAVRVDESGEKVVPKKMEAPVEFQNAIKKSAALKKAFEGLTPGRQRGYLLYFASAKQAATREARIAKYTKQILSGKGLED